MHEPLPKQFLLLRNKPLLFYSIEAFYNHNHQTRIILVLPLHHLETWRSLCASHRFEIPHEIVEGGETRFHSVRNGLSLSNDDALLAIHDGARPLVTTALIETSFQTAFSKGNCTPALPLTESIRFVDGEISSAVDRKKYKSIQTPQIFRSIELKQAYNTPYHPKFTDDATVFENHGKPIFLCDGDPLNIKITVPEDLEYAEFLLNHRSRLNAATPFPSVGDELT